LKSIGKLHLTWSVPFSPGMLTAVASDGGREVARDTLSTAGAPRSLTLTPDKHVLAADGASLSYVEATLTDARGIVVPYADNLIQFSVSGPATLTAADNGRQENAYGYTVPSMPAFNGRALAVVGATREPGTIRVTAAVEGLLKTTVTLVSVPASLVPGIPGTSEATTISFDPVRTSSVRLTMTSPAPGTADGFLAIAELGATTG
jgi:beta-galactosidase